MVPPLLRFPEDPTADLPRAHGGPVLVARLKARPEDFRVEERLGHGPDGEGEHLLLRVTKRGLNTLDVARRLADFAEVPAWDVGFAGLKDRQAVTTQVFSVRLPAGREPDWREITNDSLAIEILGRHRRKLRRGALQGNRFQIRLTEARGDRERTEALLTRLGRAGFPNYFGAQRFGRAASNLIRAQAWLSGALRRPRPEQRRMLISAARAYLFNRLLAARVEAGHWDHPLPGEVVQSGGQGRQLLVRTLDATLTGRVGSGELHPTGPLPGRHGHGLAPEGEALAFEEGVVGVPPFDHCIEALRDRGVPADRRALRTIPAQLEWRWADDALLLAFELPAGCYATSLIRELLAQRPALRESST